MYHYVRELPFTRYPAIKGLTVSDFRGQLEYLYQNYTFVRAKDIAAALYDAADLPPNAVWLTFDDGYADHYQNVFPILDEMGVEGAFFPPMEAVVRHKVLDVNKIHFILATIENPAELVKEIFSILDGYRDEWNLATNEEYFAKLAHANRFDSAEIIFIKRLLQVELPAKLRSLITNKLFNEYVSDDEAAFARELYLNETQIRCMLRHGMFFGSHGADHCWLNSLPAVEQAAQVDKSLEFLRKVGADTENWIMNYPYGAYDESLLKILRERGCRLGLTTQVAVAELDPAKALVLPRLDTNDLPKKA